MENENKPQSYIKIPARIEAIQFKNNINCINEIKKFAGNYINIKFSDNTTIIEVNTPEGVVNLSENNYLIRGIKGEFYPCREDIFIKTYKKI